MRLGSPALLVCAGLLAALSGCSPLQGYEGPSLPDAETALVIPDGRVDSNIAGRLIRNRSVRLLPGKHTLRSIYRFDGREPVCSDHEERDDAGRKECLTSYATTPAIAERECSVEAFTYSATVCVVPEYIMRCTLQAQVRAGMTYYLIFSEIDQQGVLRLIESTGKFLEQRAQCEAPVQRSARNEAIFFN